MPEPSEDEQALLERRRAEFPQLVGELRPGIAELAEFLGVERAEDLERVVDAVDASLAGADLDAADEDQRVWLHTRLMYLAGELLVDRHGGYWFLEIDRDSPLYLRYVVQIGGDEGPVVNPAELAHRFLIAEPGQRSLRGGLDAVGP